jgi:transglutaminase-like putative cysteine protease
LQLNQIDDITDYLKDSEILNYSNSRIQEKALELSLNSKNQFETIKNIYEFVRDEIPHSLDINGQKVTFKASEVLYNCQGICFAKSNLLAAMLRFLGVPAGFCYQRLTHEGGYTLHGLNAVFLDSKWYRLDARGNREDVDAQFSVDEEKLAFPVSKEGEIDYPGIYSKPLESVIAAFNGVETVDELMEKIPDRLIENDI